MRRRNKLTLAAACLVAMLAVLAGGSIAYYVASETAHNTISTSGLRVRLLEETDIIGANGEPVPFGGRADLEIGETTSLIPKVANVDSQAAYVRIGVSVSATLNTGEVVTASSDYLEADYNTTYWIKGADGYFYYKYVVDSSTTTQPLFNHIGFKQDLDNKYNDAVMTVLLRTQAVQVANNGDSALTAKGWPEE